MKFWTKKNSDKFFFFFAIAFSILPAMAKWIHINFDCLTLSRYSYVDKNAENKEYKPVIPKVEPKKLVRYRDNKIVSLKGERYTDVRRDEEAELKKPKKPICP